MDRRIVLCQSLLNPVKLFLEVLLLFDRNRWLLPSTSFALPGSEEGRELRLDFGLVWVVLEAECSLNLELLLKCCHFIRYLGLGTQALTCFVESLCVVRELLSLLRIVPYETRSHVKDRLRHYVTNITARLFS